VECLSCGRRFCSARCREWFDAGNPAYDPQAVVRINAVPSRDWRANAGPPGLEVGSAYYVGILARAKAPVIGKLANDELIRPRRLCERCGHPVPVWIKGRKVSERRKRCHRSPGSAAA
jgi:hypothetical protein